MFAGEDAGVGLLFLDDFLFFFDSRSGELSGDCVGDCLGESSGDRGVWALVLVTFLVLVFRAGLAIDTLY